jgi:asparagine synthase (glutamine-hydrolysing)
MLAPDFSALTAEATSTYAVERAIDPLSFIAFKQVPWHHFARLSVERSQLTVRSPFLDNDIVALMYRAPDELRNSLEPSLRFIQDGDARLAAMPTDRGVVYGDPSAWNRLNRLVTELSVKAEYAYDYGMPQRLATLDRLLAPLHLERLFLGRHKFYHFRVWYRDQLAPYVKEVLLDPKSLSRSYLDGREVRRLVEAHTGGRENWTLEIHRLLTLELLQRQLIER